MKDATDKKKHKMVVLIFSDARNNNYYYQLSLKDYLLLYLNKKIHEKGMETLRKKKFSMIS